MLPIMQVLPQVIQQPFSQVATIRLAPGYENPTLVSRGPMDAAMEVTETSSKILAIIFEYALNKFDDTVERLAAGMPKFLSVIDQFVVSGKQVDMCLPAFPFKSANKVYKVFGILPDKAEELALERLNTMCVRIAEVYAPGAKLTIISDGLVYNGLQSYPSFCESLLIGVCIS